MIINGKIVAGLAGLAGLLLLGGAGYAQTNAPKTATPATPSADDSSDDDADSNVFISSFVVKDGQCFRVTEGNGSKTSVPVDMSNCANPGDLGRARIRAAKIRWY